MPHRDILSETACHRTYEESLDIISYVYRPTRERFPQSLQSNIRHVRTLTRGCGCLDNIYSLTTFSDSCRHNNTGLYS